MVFFLSKWFEQFKNFEQWLQQEMEAREEFSRIWKVKAIWDHKFSHASKETPYKTICDLKTGGNAFYHLCVGKDF